MPFTMNLNKLEQNLIDQVKEAQIKLGYAKETVGLYFPAASICRLLDIKDKMKVKEVRELLEEQAGTMPRLPGQINYAVHGGRIAVNIPPEAAEYIHTEIPTPAFLTELIRLFAENHHPEKKQILAVFAAYGPDYVTEEMAPDTDFDYVIYFPGGDPDPYYYCIHEEMGHTIYHRFTEEDYHELLS